MRLLGLAPDATRSPGDDALEVTCYSGYRGGERPTVLRIGARLWRVSELVARWREPEAELFVVRLDDGSRRQLRLDTTSGRWSATEVARP